MMLDVSFIVVFIVILLLGLLRRREGVHHQNDESILDFQLHSMICVPNERVDRRTGKVPISIVFIVRNNDDRIFFLVSHFTPVVHRVVVLSIHIHA
jgi:hypothetical protein